MKRPQLGDKVKCNCGCEKMGVIIEIEREWATLQNEDGDMLVGFTLDQLNVLEAEEPCEIPL